ncbi:MAG: ROK family protein [Ignavibacteria bacterium]|nr:ROK family protein [Ignavibacteria bacterium]
MTDLKLQYKKDETPLPMNLIMGSTGNKNQETENMDTEKMVIGIDIGGTNTVLGGIDLRNNVIAEGHIKTQVWEGVHGFIKRLVAAIEKIEKENENSHSLAGIGIAAPSANYVTGVIESSANLKWGDVNFIDLLKEHYSVPIALLNDANAAALGEQLFGCAKGMKNFIVLTLGTGLGTGIVVDGKLLFGENGFAGELGHAIVEKDGRQCNCGRQGCLETYVSASGIRRTVFDLLGKYNDASELRLMNFDNVSSRMIFELAQRGDAIANKAFQYTGEILGRALANMVTYLDPQAIILSGGLAEADNYLLEPTSKYFEKFLLSVYKGKVQIRKSQLINGKAAVLGAGSFVRDQFSEKILSK